MQAFDEETLTDLRWYLEDDLTFPYGIFPDKAAKIEQNINYYQKAFEIFKNTQVVIL